MARNAYKKDASDLDYSFFEELYLKKKQDCQEVHERIFLGNAKASNDGEMLRKKRMTHIVITHPGLPKVFPKKVDYLRLPFLDFSTQNLLEKFPDLFEFLQSALVDNSEGRVLIHCSKGISRSSSSVCAWLMFTKGMSFEESFAYIEKQRPHVYPNIGFQCQLRHLEKLFKRDDYPGTDADFKEKVEWLRKVVPEGDLDEKIGIKKLIGATLLTTLDELEQMVNEVLAKAHLLSKREGWKRFGLFFENFRKYEIPAEKMELVERAEEVAKKLSALSKVYSSSIEGVKLADAVGREITGWVEVARKQIFDKAQKEKAIKNAAEEAKKKLEEAKALLSSVSSESSSSSESEDLDHLPKKERKKRKKEMKEKKKEKKKAKKAAKKQAKKERKAEKKKEKEKLKNKLKDIDMDRNRSYSRSRSRSRNGRRERSRERERDRDRRRRSRSDSRDARRSRKDDRRRDRSRSRSRSPRRRDRSEECPW